MTTVGTSRMRWVSFMGLFMLLMSITPTGVAAQMGLEPIGEVAQEDGAQMGMGIELLLVDCPPGSSEGPSDLIPGCLDGRANLNINVASVDPALGIDLPKVSEKPSDPGPGVINTGQIPLGEYRVTIDLPTEDNRFFFECRLRGTDAPVTVTPAPDGVANAFIVQNDANADVVCQAWITPSGSSPTVEITYRECNRGDFPNDDRSFEALQAHCTNVSTDPPTFNVRDLNVAGEPVSEHELDIDGKLDLTLTPGNFDMFTDLDMNTWGEYLYCEYEGQSLYPKEFHETRGITTFTNLLPDEEFTCYWFGVNEAEQPSGTEGQQEATQDTQTEPEVVEPQTQESQDTQGEPEAPDPEAQEQQDQELIEANQADDPTFHITYTECTRGDLNGDDRSFSHLSENCVHFNAPGPQIIVLSGDDTEVAYDLDATTGELQFSHAPEDFTFYSNLPRDEWGEYLYCQYGEVDLYNKPFDINTGLNGFSDLNAGEEFECFWFAVNMSDTPTDGEDTPPPPPVEETNASFNLTMIACQAEEATWDTSSLEAFRSNCTPGVENMVFNLVNQNEQRMSGVTLPTGEATIEDVPAGDWRLWSEIPLEAATEYYFCSVDGGEFSSVQLSDRGVAGFPGIDGQQINCEIYVVPENLRGEVTGSSVEVHLSICPANYEGSSWYGDCHDNGLGEMPFTLEGPAGELTADTVVERTPGPGIVRFTALPAGEYVLRGGPPQHDGHVYLYCSDPATNTQIETRFEGSMGYFTLAEEQSIVCDWYFVPVGQDPVTPTPEPTRAEIFTTMFICPPDVNVAGSTFSQLDGACSDRLSDIPMTLQSPGGVPITANTGESGEGAIRFYDLIGGDYVLTPKLPTEYVSAAVYCDLDGGDVYQKALSNGATTFVDVDGELISCSWFVTAKPQPAPGPTGSITVREMLCEGDRATIVDWERECQPGSSGVSFTITSSGGTVNETLTPNAEGVAVFTGLPNDYYDLKQSDGAWCRAKAERVDAQSRVIVSGGGNTDVFLYQCNQEIGLPDTGTGSASAENAIPMADSIMLGAGALPLFAVAAWQIRRWQMASIVSEPLEVHEALTRTRDGYRYR